MAQIVKETAIMGNFADIQSFPYSAIQPLVNDYWGTAEAERRFPIALWQMENLFAQSRALSGLPAGQGELAFKVSGISDPATVSAEWLAHNPLDEAAIQNSPEGDVYYFVFKEMYYLKDSIPFSGGLLDGLSYISPAHRHVALGRIGKEPVAGNGGWLYVAFVNLADCTIKTGGAGGGGFTSGVRVPPQP